MISRIAALLGVDALIVKLLLVALVLLCAGLGKCAYDRNLIAEHDEDVAHNVEVVTNKAEDKADDKSEAAAADFAQKQAEDERKIDHAKMENRSPLDALFD